MQVTWVPPWGREDPLEKEVATHSSTLPWEIPQTEELVGCTLSSGKELDTAERLNNNNNFHNKPLG